MAFITLDKQKLAFNYAFLNNLFKKNDIQWAVVTKLLCGHPLYLRELLKLGIKQVCDSRVSNLKMIKEINPAVETIYIKPPPKRYIEEVVKFADISMNTETKTILRLNEEAARQDKIHKIIIMVELGELREGIMGENLIAFYKGVFDLKNIEVVGIGTNLACMYGVLPSADKLVQLCLYAQLIEAKFQKKITYISGGASVTIPLIFQNNLPAGINHLRIGETLFFGTDVYNITTLEGMQNNIFTLFAEIIEITEKPNLPSGEMGQNLQGEVVSFDQNISPGFSYRAIIDLGLLDVDETHLQPFDTDISIVGSSSDMLVVDIGESKKSYKVGYLLKFRLNYYSTLKLINSRYIEKHIS
jgi:ornithine racemase